MLLWGLGLDLYILNGSSTSLRLLFLIVSRFFLRPFAVKEKVFSRGCLRAAIIGEDLIAKSTISLIIFFSALLSILIFISDGSACPFPSPFTNDPVRK